MPEKTHEETKRGLECHSLVAGGCAVCPYNDLGDGDCSGMLVRDALAYIQQLEEDNAKKHEKIMQLYIALENMQGIVQSITKDSKTTFQQLETKCYQLERERDAAVADLAEVKDCLTCKHSANCKIGSFDCYHCSDKDCPCLTCQYVWRGAKESKPNVIELLQADNTKELLEKIEQLVTERDEAYEAICDHCMDIPCQENECYWYRKMNQTEETKP